MPDELLRETDWETLQKKLIKAFLTVDGLKSWLASHLSTALPRLEGRDLGSELTNLMVWAKSDDGMREFLQQLADHPPGGDVRLPAVIEVLTGRRVIPKGNNWLPDREPHESLFAANRPFVNRRPLRDRLDRLRKTSTGSECIMVIDGEDRSGKSFSLCLARSCQDPKSRLPTIDMEGYARSGEMVDAGKLAGEIAGEEWSQYDPTKENASIYSLVQWLSGKLLTKPIWIIIDHCNRKVVTQGARSLLKELALKIGTGDLPGTRLILVDFNPEELPDEVRDDVLHDRAVLPDRDTVRDWCSALATAANRKHAPEEVQQWVSEVFQDLDQHPSEDGTWHREFQRRLKQAVERIRACEEQP